MDTSTSSTWFGFGFANNKTDKPFENDMLSAVFWPGYATTSGDRTVFTITKTQSQEAAII